MKQICTPGYSRAVRDVSRAKKNAVLKRYGLTYVKGAYEIDHLEPICLGGSNELENLWPMEVEEAQKKARLDGYLCREVCRGNLELETARRMIRSW